VKVKSEFEGPESVSPAVKATARIIQPSEHMPTFEARSFPHALLTAPPEGTIVFFQMPNKLPVLDQTPTPDSALIKETKLSSDISVLPEGYIGKIQILASGRSRLVLGENHFEIEPGKAVAFREV
jgi:hypothetical protein